MWYFFRFEISFSDLLGWKHYRSFTRERKFVSLRAIGIKKGELLHFLTELYAEVLESVNSEIRAADRSAKEEWWQRIIAHQNQVREPEIGFAFADTYSLRRARRGDGDGLRWEFFSEWFLFSSFPGKSFEGSSDKRVVDGGYWKIGKLILDSCDREKQSKIFLRKWSTERGFTKTILVLTNERQSQSETKKQGEHMCTRESVFAV